jgi:hypothetical protein
MSASTTPRSQKGAFKNSEAAVTVAAELAEYIKSLRMNTDLTLAQQVEGLKRAQKHNAHQLEAEQGQIEVFEQLMQSDSVEGDAGILKAGAVAEKLQQRSHPSHHRILMDY